MSNTHVSLEAMNLNLMLALHWLLVERNVTRAAARLGITQSAMSRRLGQLRLFFDDPLLAPVGRRLEPTPRALGLREPLARVVDDMRRLLREETPFDPADVTGTMLVVATEHALGALLPAVVPELRAHAPGLELRVEPAAPDAWTRLASGRVELLLAPKIGPLPRGLHAHTLWRERFVTVLRPGHPDAGRPLTLERFCALDHVVVYPLGGTRLSTVSRALAERGLDRRVAVQVPYFATALALVASTDLVLTLPASLAPDTLVRCSPPLPLPGFALQVVWPERLDSAEPHAWVRSVMSATARSVMPDAAADRTSNG